MERVGSWWRRRLIHNSTSLQKAVGIDDPNLLHANSSPGSAIDAAILRAGRPNGARRVVFQ